MYEDSQRDMTTQEIHQALNQRAHRKIPLKHLQTLMERFSEIYGTEVTDDNLESFLRYAWE